MRKLKVLLLALAAILTSALPSPAPAQSIAPGLTAGCSSPPPAYGVVWTASQWIVCLTSLQPFLGYIPLNAGGGIMSGQLGLSPSVTTAAPLNFQIGVAPTSPANGNVWFTSAGIFYQAGGATVGPLAGTTSPTLNNPTLTGTVTLPSGATFTSAGGQGFAHLYVNRTTDAGGAQLLQVQGNGYVSGGFSAGLTSATSGGFVAGTAATAIASSAALDFSTSARLSSYGASNSTYSALTVNAFHSDGTGVRTATLLDTSGNTQFPGTVSFGTSSTDNVQASGGASGGTLTTSAGTLTLSSGGGATTILSDTAVRISAAGYHTCSLLGTDGSGNITCGGAPSGYITYNDNVTADPSPAVTGNLYCMNTGSGALNLTLPASPANGDYVAFSDCGGNFGTHNLTIIHNGHNIMYNNGDMVVSTVYAGAVLRYSLGKTSWILSPL